MLKIGITGAVASGKSSVAHGLKQAGFPVIDADDLVRTLYAGGGPPVDQVLQEFPAVRTDHGGIDRKRLGQIVFGDADALARLEAIVHPHLLQGIRAWYDSKQSAPAVVVEAALWHRWASQGMTDVMVTVHATRENRKARLLEGGLSEAEAEARLDAQGIMPTEETDTHWVIHNDGSLAELEDNAAMLAGRILKLSEIMEQENQQEGLGNGDSRN